MHQKYGKDGLVCMSVTVDDKEEMKAALSFLQKVNATFPNFLLNEDVEVWQTRWNINGPPAVFVFDRAGRRAAKFDTSDPDKPYGHEDVEKVVRQLLQGAE